MIHALVDQLQQKATLSPACQVLTVSRSGYYAAMRRAKSTALWATGVHLNAAFAARDRRDVSRRLVSELRARQIVSSIRPNPIRRGRLISRTSAPGQAGCPWRL